MKPGLALILLVACLTLVNCETLHLRREDEGLLHDQSLSPRTPLRSGGLGGAVTGFIFGPILFILSFICIWNNEKKAAIDHRRMKLAETLVNQVNPFDVQQMRQADGKLVHVTGDTQCNETLADRESGITMNNVIKLKRDVEVRQMRQFGSDNNRRWQPMWVSSNQPSPGGGFINDPTAWFITSTTHNANNVMLGNYVLSQSLKDSLPFNQNYAPSMQNAYSIARGSQGKVRNQPIINDGYIYFPAVANVLDSPGTLRVRYMFCPTGETSIISQSSQNTFVPFRIDIAENGKPDVDHSQEEGCCCCLLSDCTAGLLAPMKEINLISQRKQSYHEMIENQKKIIATKKNLIRLGSYFLMVFSICAFFSPITTLLGYVPLLGGFLSGVVGLAIFIAALIVCIPLFLLAVAISWLVFHPKVGLILLGVALLITGLVFLIIQLNKPKGSPADASASTTAKHLLYSMRSLLNQM